MHVAQATHLLGHETANNLFGHAFDKSTHHSGHETANRYVFDESHTSFRSRTGQQLLWVCIWWKQHTCSATKSLTTSWGMHLAKATHRSGHEKINNCFGYACGAGNTSVRPREGSQLLRVSHLGHEKVNNFFGYGHDESNPSYRPREGS